MWYDPFVKTAVAKIKTFSLVLASLALISAMPAAAASIQLVSVRDSSMPVPAGGSGDSDAAVISSDGRYVLFESMAPNLVVISNPGPASGLLPRRMNVFLRDRLGAMSTLVSFNFSGNGGGNGDSFTAGISTNGQIALFESAASDLVLSDTNNASDIFLRDLASNKTTLISVRTNGGSGNGVSRNATMSPDGRYIAFVSAANNLVVNDTNGIPDVFVRDRLAGTTTLVSVGAKSIGSTSSPLGSSESPDITPDGRYIAFYSSATNLVPGVTNIGEVYVRDLVANTTTLASTNARTILQSVAGTQNGISCNHRISDDGRFVAFVTATNPIASLYSRGVVMQRDLQAGVTQVVHTNANVPWLPPEDIRNLDMTPDGRYVAFVANTSAGGAATCVYRWDGQTTTKELVSQNLSGGVAAGTSCDWPRMDASGRYVTFFCSAANLTFNTLVSGPHLYLRDLSFGSTELINQDAGGTGYGVNSTTAPGVSADGQVITFDAMDGGLVTSDNNGANDVFARDRLAFTTELISARDPSLASLTPNGSSGVGSFSVNTNGHHVAFASDASDLVSNDANGLRDVFVRDLVLTTTTLASVGTSGLSGNGNSFDPSVSADGRYVAFASYANNLVAGDANTASDIFVRDMLAGTTSVVSLTTNGLVNANGDSRMPAISADGRYVTFWSAARNLVTASTTGENLFQRDLQTGITRALTTGGVTAASQTPDGSRVAFVGLIPGDVSAKAYVWNSQTAARIYTNSTSSLIQSSISPNGQRLALLSGSGTLTLRVVNLVANTNVVVATASFTSSAGLKFSADGRYLTFSTFGALTAADTNATLDVYLYDFQSGTNLLVSRGYSSPGTPGGSAGSPCISADGRWIAYRSLANNAVPDDFNSVADLLLYDRSGGATLLITASQTGNRTGNNFSLLPAFSDDGKTLVFSSWATDLLDHDHNSGSDLIALSLATEFTDLDNDNMDDAWETGYFSTSDRDGEGDYDSDGASDLNEFLAHTNPTNSISLFRTAISYGPNPSLRWPASPWTSYRVQYKNDLNDSVWLDLNANVTLMGANGLALDLSPATSNRFYRILLND